MLLLTTRRTTGLSWTKLSRVPLLLIGERYQPLRFYERLPTSISSSCMFSFFLFSQHKPESVCYCRSHFVIIEQTEERRKPNQLQNNLQQLSFSAELLTWDRLSSSQLTSTRQISKFPLTAAGVRWLSFCGKTTTTTAFRKQPSLLVFEFWVQWPPWRNNCCEVVSWRKIPEGWERICWCQQVLSR